MDSAYAPVCWIRKNGQRIAVESMTDHELVYGREMLGEPDYSDPVAAALSEAVHQEARRRNL